MKCDRRFNGWKREKSSWWAKKSEEKEKKRGSKENIKP